MCTIFKVIVKAVNMVPQMILSLLCLIENVFMIIIQNIFNAINFCCQICSLIPVCCVFIITSKLRCFLSGNSSWKSGSEIGFSCFIMTILTMIVVFYLLDTNDYIDVMIDRIGYIHKNKVKWNLCTLLSERMQKDLKSDSLNESNAINKSNDVTSNTVLLINFTNNRYSASFCVDGIHYNIVA